MGDQGSITRLIGGLRTGESGAALSVWNHFYTRLVAIARQRLNANHKRVADEEDIVIDAFDSFFRGTEEGRFPKLNDRDDLWEVLLMLTCRKSTNQLLYTTRQKRGSGKVRGDSAFGTQGSADQLVGQEPSPEFAAEFAEQFRERLSMLEDQVLERVATMKLEGFTNQEIASSLGCKERTVQRKLRTIRAIWTVDED